MIQYSSLNDAWGIDNSRKETFKNILLPQEPMRNTNEKNQHVDECIMFNHIFTCEECLNKLKQKLNIPKVEYFVQPPAKQIVQKNVPKPTITNLIVEGFTETMNNNKDLKQLILIILIFILVILIIQSFRKPSVIPDLQSKFYIYPEEISKLRKILDSI